MIEALDTETMETPALSPSGLARMRELLFANPDESTYAVLDGAQIPELLEHLRAAPEEHACLYRGELEPDLEAAAPHIVKLRPDSPLTEWLLTGQWGRSAGIFAVTPIGLEALRRHFRGFLRVRDHTGKVLYFRWYDPRVLRVYLPTCNAEEIKTVFGPVSRFVCEAEDPLHAIAFPAARLKVRPETHSLAERKE